MLDSQRYSEIFLWSKAIEILMFLTLKIDYFIIKKWSSLVVVSLSSDHCGKDMALWYYTVDAPGFF